MAELLGWSMLAVWLSGMYSVGLPGGGADAALVVSVALALAGAIIGLVVWNLLGALRLR